MPWWLTVLLVAAAMITGGVIAYVLIMLYFARNWPG